MKMTLYKAFRGTCDFVNRAKVWITGMMVSLMVFLMSTPAFADDFGTSKLATGTKKLIEDVTTWLLVIAPLVTVVALIYYFIRKTVSDEIDHKKWNTRIVTAIICCIGVVAASLIIKLVTSYYG